MAAGGATTGEAAAIAGAVIAFLIFILWHGDTTRRPK